MGLFDRKNKKEKGTPFWKCGKETAEAEPIIERTEEEPEEFAQIAEETIRERQQQEQDAVQQACEDAEQVVALEETRQEAIALARQAALDAQREETQSDSADYEPDAQEEEPDEEPVEEPEEELEEESKEELEEVSGEEPEEKPEEEPEETSSEVPDKQEEKSLFAKLRQGLRKTKNAMLSRMHQVLSGFTKIDDDLFDELEETMIMSDLGPETSVQICDLLRQRVKERGVTDPKEIMGMIQEILTEMLGEDQELTYPTKPTIVLVIGVNGAGKTTTIGKLCYQLKQEGKKVIVAAADTFRAAAIDQLAVWTDRAGVDLVKHAEGSDPGAVVYDAIAAAKARDCDVLICDTAGRLHNKKNLMQELAKINRISTTQAEDCHVEVLLVLDATTGQNAVNQARLFQEMADITGIVLTKLDGTAKGGIIVSIRNELGIPVKLVGVGEKIDDLQSFHGADFVRAIFSPNEEA